MINVSIAVVTYNSARFLDRCIRSLLDQEKSHLAIEIIVVDDGSIDETPAILSKFGTVLTVETFPENRGVGAASAAALSLANGEYFMRVDSDDFINRFTVEFLVSVASANHEASFFFSDYYLVDERGFKEERRKKDSLRSLLTHGAGILFSTEALRSVGGYDSTLRDCEDYDLLARLILEGHQGIRTPIPLYRYRRHDANLTGESQRRTNVNRMDEKYAGIQDRASQIYWGTNGCNSGSRGQSSWPF